MKTHAYHKRVCGLCRPVKHQRCGFPPQETGASHPTVLTCLGRGRKPPSSTLAICVVVAPTSGSGRTAFVSRSTSVCHAPDVFSSKSNHYRALRNRPIYSCRIRSHHILTSSRQGIASPLEGRSTNFAPASLRAKTLLHTAMALVAEHASTGAVTMLTTDLW